MVAGVGRPSGRGKGGTVREFGGKILAMERTLSSLI